MLKTKWCRSHAVAYSDPSEGPFVEQIMNLEFKHIAIASSQVIYLKTNHFSHAHAERRKAPPTNMDIPVTMVEIILIRPEEEPSGAVTDASLS